MESDASKLLEKDPAAFDTCSEPEVIGRELPEAIDKKPADENNDKTMCSDLSSEAKIPVEEVKHQVEERPAEHDGLKRHSVAGDAAGASVLTEDVIPTSNTGARPKVKGYRKYSTSEPRLSGAESKDDSSLTDAKLISSSSAHEHRRLVDARRRRFDANNESSLRAVEGTGRDLSGKDANKSLTEDSELLCSNQEVKHLREKNSTGTERLKDRTDETGSEACSDSRDSRLGPRAQCPVVTPPENRDELASGNDSATIELKEVLQVPGNEVGEPSGELTDQRSKQKVRTKWSLPRDDEGHPDSTGMPPFKRKKSGPDWLRQYEKHVCERRPKSDSELEATVSELADNVKALALPSTDCQCSCGQKSGVLGEAASTSGSRADEASQPSFQGEETTAKCGKFMWKSASKKKGVLGEKTKRSERRPHRKYTCPPAIPSDEAIEKASEVIGSLADDLMAELLKDLELEARKLVRKPSRPTPKTRESVPPASKLAPKSSDVGSKEGNGIPPLDAKSCSNGSSATRAFEANDTTEVTPSENGKGRQDDLPLNVEYEELQKILLEFCQSCEKEDNVENDNLPSSSSSSSVSETEIPESEETEHSTVEGKVQSDETSFGSICPHHGFADMQEVDIGTSQSHPGKNVSEQHVSNSGDFDGGIVIIDDIIRRSDSMEHSGTSESDSSPFENIQKDSKSSGKTSLAIGEGGDVPSKKKSSPDASVDGTDYASSAFKDGATASSSSGETPTAPEIDADGNAAVERVPVISEDSKKDENSEVIIPTCPSHLSSSSAPNDFQPTSDEKLKRTLRNDEASSASTEGYLSPPTQKQNCALSDHEGGECPSEAMNIFDLLKISMKSREESFASDDFSSMRAEPNSFSDISFDDSETSRIGEEWEMATRVSQQQITEYLHPESCCTGSYLEQNQLSEPLSKTEAAKAGDDSSTAAETSPEMKDVNSGEACAESGFGPRQEQTLSPSCTIEIGEQEETSPFYSVEENATKHDNISK